LFTEDLVVRDHLEGVPADEVLHADQVSGGAVGSYSIARIVLFHPADHLELSRDQLVRREHVPTCGVEIRCPVVRADEFGSSGPSPRPVHRLGIVDRAVTVTGSGAAHIQPPNRRHHRSGEVGHMVVRVVGAIRSFSVDDRRLQCQPWDVPVCLHADVAPGDVDDTRALGCLERRRAEQ